MLQVLRGLTTKTKPMKYLQLIGPFVPTILPTLLFCRLAETLLLLSSGQLEPDVWANLLQESLLLDRVSNDVKIIGGFQLHEY